MTTRSAMLLTACALAAPLAPLGAQLISIKTVPIADGEQFSLYPSRLLGMGSVSVAVDDTLLDPFRNPATGARVRGALFFGSPVVYSVSSDAGGGRTLPLGAMARSASWFSALSIAAQHVDEPGRGFPPPVVDRAFVTTDASLRFDEEPRHNMYAFAMLGRTFSESGLSLAASAEWAKLNAVDGVELLYAGSSHLRQFGGSLDLRLGLLKEFAGERELEAVLVHNRYGMTHDVTYVDWLWDPNQQRMVPTGRLEHNPDRTHTWGIHLEYERPLTSDGWRVGSILTANRMSHPKIPNYEIMSIPRDPGYSNAFNVGLGFSRVNGPATVAVDIIYEPIWSDTWAEAESAIETSNGGTIAAGGKTIENDFRFSNAMLRLGLARDEVIEDGDSRLGFQLGLALRSVHYWLAQRDNVQGTTRGLEEQWVEWTPTWGLSLRFPELEIRYAGRSTNGTGRPGVGNPGGFVTAPDAAGGRSVLVAPSGPLTLDEVRVTTHQISVSFPLR